MTTYKAFLKVLKKNIWMIGLYTLILVVCMIGNSQNKNSMTNFTAAKPLVTIQDNDDSLLSRKLKDYMTARSDMVELKTDEELNDALYFDGTDYVIMIDKGFGEKIAKGEKPEMLVKSVGNYRAYLAETIYARFLKVVEAFAPASEEEISKNLDQILEHETDVEMAAKIDVDGLANAKNYYNFMSYAIIAGLVFAVAYTTSAFKKEMVKKRLMVSATKFRSINSKLLICNLVIALVMLVFYVGLSVLMVGSDVIFTMNGLFFVLNGAVLSVCAVAFAFLLTNLLKNNNAILAVINVVALGSCFLCGVFVPAEWMPEFVQNLGRALPSYYYTESNQIISELDIFNFETLRPVLINMLIIVGATILIMVINNIVIRKKQKN